jgi:hypothetical protein
MLLLIFSYLLGKELDPAIIISEDLKTLPAFPPEEIRRCGQPLPVKFRKIEWPG